MYIGNSMPGDREYYLRVDDRDEVYLIEAITSSQTSGATAAIPEPEERLFPEWTLDKVLAIRLQDPQEDIAFSIVRGPNNEWIIPEADIELEQQAAIAIVQGLVSLSYHRTLPIIDETQLNEFGLDSNRAILLIQIILQGDEQGHNIAVGAITPTRESYYLLVDERDSIYLVRRDHAPIDFLISSLIREEFRQ
jgi:hypothetical protein